MDLSMSGLASGFDWKTLVDQMTEIERTPQTNLRQEQSTLQQRNTALDTVKGKLTDLKTAIDTLKESTFYDGRTATMGDSTVASASASAGTPLGSYAFNITKLASAAMQNGNTNAGGALNSENITTSSTSAGPQLSTLGFASTVTAGIITINGQQIQVDTTDTMQGLFSKIKTATGDVEAAYDAATDTFSLTGTDPIVLGSATDTSNFLTLAKLNNNGTNSITSSGSLGAVKTTSTLATANMATAMSGTGIFKINGVELSYNADTESVATLLDKINQSKAGVYASYDANTDRFSLTNKTSGDIGIALEDVSGNFLSATQLLDSSGATLARGTDLQYTVNSGPTLLSHSNIITADSSGVSGLTVTALKLGTTSVTVSSDTSKVRTAITSFIEKYNAAQSLLSAYTASSTDSKGKVTAGLLTGDMETASMAGNLRSAAFAAISGLTGSITNLDSLGISTSGYDDKLTLSDSTKLDAALASNLTDIQSFFSDSSSGLGTRLSTYLDNLTKDEGSLATRQETISKQSAKIDTQIEELERIVQSNRTNLINSFVAMENARSQLTQQSNFLSSQIK